MNHLPETKAKRIAISSFHTNKKDLVEWAYKHKEVLEKQDLLAMGNTSALLAGTLNANIKTIPSVLTGGDRMLMDMLRNGEIDVLILFFDTKNANRREKYVRDILQLAINMNVVVGCNRATADVIMDAFTLAQNQLLGRVTVSDN